MAYATTAQVRLVSGLTTAEVSDADMASLIGLATEQLNAEVNSRVYEEKILYIDAVRDNDIDGINTTFYLKKGYDFFIADTDNDGDVGTTDITIFKVDTSVDPNTKTEVAAATLDDEMGKFTLAAAPETIHELYSNYSYAPLKEGVTCHALIKQACIFLTAALAETKIEAKNLGSFRIGDYSETATKSASFTHFYGRYLDVLRNIKSRIPVVKKYD